jgi:hypothetical protein
VVVQRCQQVHLVAVAGRAAQRLAVDGDHSSASRARRAQPVGQPRADRPVEPIAVDPCQHPADGGLAGDLAAAGERVTAYPERGQDRPGRVRGPLGDRGDRPGAGQDRRGGHGKDRDQRVAAARTPSRVVDRGEVGEQVRPFGRPERGGAGEQGEGSWDEG